MEASEAGPEAGLIAFVEHEVYSDESLKAAFEISAADIKYVNQVAGSQKAVNYGEVLPLSWLRVLDAVNPSPHDVFYDLGSGRGVLTVLTHLHCGLRKSVGVELSRERHAMAERALLKLQTSPRKDSAPGISFVCGDIRTCDLSDATFVFLMNQDMPHKLNADVWRRLLALERPLTVATLHPPKDVNLGGLQPWRTLTLPQTWNGAVPLHIYRLPGGSVPVAPPKAVVCVMPKRVREEEAAEPARKNGKGAEPKSAKSM